MSTDDHQRGEASEADALDQSRVVGAAEERQPVARGFDVPEADAIEQAIEVPIDADEEPEPRDES